MKTYQLRTNQLSAEAYDWYLSYLAALDNRDVEAYAGFLDNGCVMQRNNDEPIAGKAAIKTGLAQYWQSFGSLEHDLLNLYGTDRGFMLEALNHYERLDGRRVTLRAVALTDRNEAGLVISIRFYTDTTPLFTK